MVTGWVLDNGKWYYLYNDGSMACNIVTPDVYQVDITGAWINTNSNTTTDSLINTIVPAVTNPTTPSVNTTNNSSTSTSSSASSSSISSSSNSSITNKYKIYFFDGETPFSKTYYVEKNKSN